MVSVRVRIRRPGTVLPVAALCATALCGFLALAIDVGMIAVARNQCQNAADSAAMAGARTFNGDASGSYNESNVPKNAVTAAIANQVLNSTIPGDPNTSWSFSDPTVYTFSTGNVTVKLGSYTYVYNDSNPSSEKFQLNIPRASTSDPWSAVNVTVTYAGTNSFARIFGASGFNTSATATSIHRPRDVSIIVDLSGSMRFQSLPGGNYWGQRSFSLNPESVFPQFGHYSDTNAAALQGTTSQYMGWGVMLDPSNISTTNDSGPCIIADFRQSSSVATAFSRAPDSQATAPGGDNYKKVYNNAAAYASTVQDIVNSTSYDSTWETSGYGANFKGYTEGPGYWGKTFFIWPPDPRTVTQSPPSSLTDTTYAFWHNNGASDWRQRFFVKVDTTNGNKPYWLDDSSILYDSSSEINTPGTTTTIGGITWTYRINYAAILYWLRTVGTAGRVDPFPNSLWCGRISYYTAIPDPTDATTGKALNNRFWTQNPLTDLNERFWKDYIDFVLGLQGTGANSYNQVIGMIGNGDVYSWGSQPGQITSQLVENGAINNSGGYSSGASSIKLKSLSQSPVVGQKILFGSSNTSYTIQTVSSWSSGTVTVTISPALGSSVSNGSAVHIFRKEYMNYQDNPYRPRHQLWFGPMTMVDFLGNYNTGQFWWPGNVHEAQGWACKMGVQSAIQDIKNNHPNDFVTLSFFSTPDYDNNDTSGRYNHIVVPLGQQYQRMIDSLWFPTATITGGLSQINCYDSAMNGVPRAMGGTAPGTSFMLTYNQFSSSYSNLRSYSTPQSTYRGDAGGLCRKGASRLIIFETDGEPNTGAKETIVSSSADSYYPIRMKNPADVTDSANVEFPNASSFSTSDITAVATQICALTTASPPGYSTTIKPVLIHCIAFGYLFDPTNAGADQTSALSFLQQLQTIGKVQSSSSTALESYKRIYGPYQTRIDNLRQAFTNIMQSGIQVSLIQ